MLSIQDLGLSIMGDSPKNFYILGGNEFGIKEKYISILSEKFGRKIEYSNFLELIASMSKKQIISTPPALYVVRYDKLFLSKLNTELHDKIIKCKINGCILLIYEAESDIRKCDKFFPENTAEVINIDSKYIIKYLQTDFPDTKPEYYQIAANLSANYYQAKNICRCLKSIQDKYILSEAQARYIFGMDVTYSDKDMMLAVANRDFNSVVYISEHYDGDVQNIFYTILRTMLELEKCLSSKYSDSPIKKAAKLWNYRDIYFYFNHVYSMLKDIRSGYISDTMSCIIYLAALLGFKNIPNKI